jgi:hypothetical protein
VVPDPGVSLWMFTAVPPEDGQRSSAVAHSVGVQLVPLGGLYLLEGVRVTVCAVATVAGEGSPGVAVFG